MTAVPIIVGAGIIGCSIARELAVRGLAPLVIDQRPPGAGATQASAGMLAPYVEGHESGPLLELGVRSLALYDDWIAAISREAGVDVEYRRIGTLEVALDSAEADRLKHQTDAASVTRTWMAADAARRTHPALGSIAGALYTPLHGYVD